MSFSEWVSRKFSARISGQQPGKRGRRRKTRLRCEELEPRRLLAMTVQLIGPTWVMEPDQMATPPNGGFTTKPDRDYYSVLLTFHQGTNVVDYVIDDLGPFNNNLPARQTGQMATTGAAPAIEVLFNDPGNDYNLLAPGVPLNVNSLECEDVSNDQGPGTMLYSPGNPATLGQSATFGIKNFLFPGGGFGGGSNIEGPYIEYNFRAHTTPPGVLRAAQLLYRSALGHAGHFRVSTPGRSCGYW